MTRSTPHGPRNGSTEARAVDVVVVGAGLAGLTAAAELAHIGVSVLVLEARDRVGGRVLNANLGDGKVVEMGGQFFGPTHRCIAALARSLGVESFPTYDSGDRLIEIDGKRRRYRGDIPRLDARTLLDFGQARFLLDRLAHKVPLDVPWNAPHAERWDRETLWSWARRNTYTARGRALFELAVRAVWAAEPCEVSLLDALRYVHGAGSLEELTTTGGGAQQDRFVGGSQLIALRLAQRLGARVMLDSPVRRIEQRGHQVRVVSDRMSAVARRAVIALPPPLAARIAFEPALPGSVAQLAQWTALGTVIKCMAVYDEPFWRRDGLSGQASSAGGPVGATFDNSPPDGSPGVLLGFVVGRPARELARQSPDRRRSAVLESFARLFGGPAARPARFLEKSWADDQWTRGRYFAFTAPGALTSYRRDPRSPIGRLHWAGAETATTWYGSMDGAVASGQCVAAEIVAAGVDPARRHARHRREVDNGSATTRGRATRMPDRHGSNHVADTPRGTSEEKQARVAA